MQRGLLGPGRPLPCAPEEGRRDGRATLARHSRNPYRKDE